MVFMAVRVPYYSELVIPILKLLCLKSSTAKKDVQVAASAAKAKHSKDGEQHVIVCALHRWVRSRLSIFWLPLLAHLSTLSRRGKSRRSNQTNASPGIHGLDIGNELLRNFFTGIEVSLYRMSFWQDTLRWEQDNWGKNAIGIQCTY